MSRLAQMLLTQRARPGKGVLDFRSRSGVGGCAEVWSAPLSHG
jgi:hypothetical protein